MSDNDATRRRHRVADPLREFVKAYGSTTYNETHKMTFGEYEAKLLDFADQIDCEHEHEMEQLRRSRFREGYEAGQRSMDAEHYAVALRLKHLPLDEDSHGNLSQIARAVWHSDFGWTKGACEALRDELVRLLGGVHDDPAPIPASGGACDADCDCHNQQPQTVAMYDVLDNERHKAVCRLREFEPMIGSKPTEEASKLIRCITGKSDSHVACGNDLEETRDRLIHLLGGDEPAESLIETLVKKTEELSRQGKVRFPPNADGSLEGLKTVEEIAALIDEVKRRADQSHELSPTSLENETGNGACENCRITDELRKFVESEYSETIEWYQHPQTLIAIADRIDEQFNRICWQQEAVLQQTIDTMVDEREKLADNRDMWRGKAMQLTDVVDRYVRRYEDVLELLRDAAKDYKQLRRAYGVAYGLAKYWRRMDKGELFELLRDAAEEYEDMRMERDELQRMLNAIREALDG